jgi:mono/diheme cytochrome c family protein
MIRRLVLGLLVVIVLAVGGFSIYVASRQNIHVEHASPAIAASADSAVIARGHYLVWSAGPCAGCHGDPAQHEARDAGVEVPLSGGFTFDIPPGKFHIPNITSDLETGIGRIPDSLIARALRYGVRHDGRVLLPFMEFQGLADDDLLAIVSYLRTLPATPHLVPAHEPNVLGRIMYATMFATPVGPVSKPPAQSPRGATVDNGKYLVEGVSLCGACHTQRDAKTAQFTGAQFAGSTGMTDDYNPKRTWSPPNLTSAPNTGKLGKLSEDEFVARMRAGRVIPGSPMPWQNFRNMSEDDLRAIYKFIASVPATENDVGPPFVDGK